MADIRREHLKMLVWVTAHNQGELTDAVQRAIENYDLPTYKHLIQKQLIARAQADRTGSAGGGAETVEYLQEALDHLEHILSNGLP